MALAAPQPPPQKHLVDAAAKAWYAVDRHDRYALSKLLHKFRFLVDIHFPWQEAITQKNPLGLVTQMAPTACVKDDFLTDHGLTTPLPRPNRLNDVLLRTGILAETGYFTVDETLECGRLTPDTRGRKLAILRFSWYRDMSSWCFEMRTS